MQDQDTRTAQPAVPEPHASGMREAFLAEIERGEVKMRPRWHFVLIAAVAVLSFIVLILALLYVASLAHFLLRTSGVWFAPRFGWSGWMELLRGLPWLLVLLVTVLVVALEMLVRRYAFAYRQPILVSVFVIMIIVVAGGFLVSRTQLHPIMYDRVNQGRMPMMGRMYRMSLPRDGHIFRGDVLTVTPPELLVHCRHNKGCRGMSLRVMTSPETRLPPAGLPVAGQQVIIFGDRTGDIIMAHSIRTLINQD